MVPLGAVPGLAGHTGVAPPGPALALGATLVLGATELLGAALEPAVAVTAGAEPDGATDALGAVLTAAVGVELNAAEAVDAAVEPLGLALGTPVVADATGPTDALGVCVLAVADGVPLPPPSVPHADNTRADNPTTGRPKPRAARAAELTKAKRITRCI
jgi:hypothetical protein